MRLLLDEMWSHEIAFQLRRRGHDAIAITEPEQEARFGSLDNVGDFERARLAFARTRRNHHGVIYACAPQFNRNLGAGVIGPMVRALERLVLEHPDREPGNDVIYLRRAE